MATGEWRGARDAFSAVLEVAEVPEALFGLASALFWLGDIAGTIAYCEKAYAGFRRRGDLMFAAGAALSLVGYNKGYLGNTAAARGWLSRGQDHRERGPGTARGTPGGHRVRDRGPGRKRGAGAAGGRDRAGERPLRPGADGDACRRAGPGAAGPYRGRHGPAGRGDGRRDRRRVRRSPHARADELHDDGGVRQLFRSGARDAVGAVPPGLHRAVRMPVLVRGVPHLLRPGPVR